MNFQHRAETKRWLGVISDGIFERGDFFTREIQDIDHSPIISGRSIEIGTQLAVIFYERGKSTSRRIEFLSQIMVDLGRDGSWEFQSACCRKLPLPAIHCSRIFTVYVASMV